MDDNSKTNLSKHKTKLISKVAKDNGFKNFKFQAEDGSNLGDNYVGQITAIKIKENNEEKVLDLILKHSKTNDAFRKDGQASSVFVREAKMYGEVLPKMLKFQADANVSKPFLGVAKCYGWDLTPHQECILMENLKSKQFKMWNRRIPISHDHVVLVFTEYAKFHAISFAMKNKNPEKFEALTKELTSVMGGTEEIRKLFSSYKKTALECLTEKELKTALEKGWKNMEDTYVDMRNEKFVIQHGDAWCNNILFQYEKETSEKPTYLYLLDWQNSKMGSPVWDLLYFFCVCSSKEVLPNYRKYLDIFHRALSKNLNDFGCNPDEVFSFETLISQWNKYAKMGLFCMLMVGQILVVEEADIPTNFDELRKDKSKTLSDILNLDAERQKQYNQRLTDLVELLVKGNFL